MKTAAQTTLTPRHDPALWFGLLGAPMMWSVYHVLLFFLTKWACSTGRALILDLLTVLAVGVSILALGTAIRRRKTPAASDLERFLVRAGVASSAVFLFVISVIAMPRLFLPCE